MIIFGVAISTLVTLFVVPVFYALLARYTHSPEALAHKLDKLEDETPVVTRASCAASATVSRTRTPPDGERFLAGEVVDLSHPVFAIEVDGRACGGIGARPGQGDRRHSAEMGYWLGHALWGRGLMTQAVALYAPWLMRELALYRLQATVLDSNPASARVLQKNGFEEEGAQRCAVVKFGEVHDLRVFAKVRRNMTDAT